MSIEEKLRDAGLKFDTAHIPGTIAHGGLRGIFSMGEGGRTHSFIVSSEPDDHYGLLDYDVLCPIKVGPSAEDAFNAARIVSTMKRGGIVADDMVLYVRMDMPANQSGADMILQIGGLCSIADDIEKALFGTDEL